MDSIHPQPAGVKAAERSTFPAYSEHQVLVLSDFSRTGLILTGFLLG